MDDAKKINNALTALVQELKGRQGPAIWLKDILEYEAGIKISIGEAKRIVKNRS